MPHIAATRPKRPAFDWLAWILVSAVFLAVSFGRVPIPGINEPHYLTKAKHLFDPQWCPGDLFLESSNPHLVFYWLIGPLLKVTSFYNAALIGRIAGLLVFSAGWTVLTRRLFDSDTRSEINSDEDEEYVAPPFLWPTVAAAAIFALLQTVINWSGEWVLGGVESKVFSYGFLLWAFGEISAPLGSYLGNGRGAGKASRQDLAWLRAGTLLGLAISFHPVVGGWGAIYIVAALVLLALDEYGAVLMRINSQMGPSNRGDAPPLSKWKALLKLILVAAVFAAPGLWATASTLVASDPEMAWNAAKIQLTARLRHHLDPWSFSYKRHLAYAAIVWFWWFSRNSALALSRRWDSRPLAWKFFDLIGVWAILIALLGVAAAWRLIPAGTVADVRFAQGRVSFLRLYPFRVPDLLVPLMLSFSIGGALGRGQFRNVFVWVVQHRISRKWFQWAVALSLVPWAIWTRGEYGGLDRNPSHMSQSHLEDWKATCTWLRTNTPENSLVQVGERGGYAVKWFAERPEYFDWKDCPQDAASITEWNRRVWKLHKWIEESSKDDIITDNELDELRETTKIRYLVMKEYAKFQRSPVFANSSYQIVDLNP